jgi:hypothetical protein
MEYQRGENTNATSAVKAATQQHAIWHAARITSSGNKLIMAKSLDKRRSARRQYTTAQRGLNKSLAHDFAPFSPRSMTGD